MTSTNATTTGPRQRKSNNSKQRDEEDNKDNTWTYVDEDNNLEDEEGMKLLQQDPINFFGLPSHDLKLAQEQAKLALEGYIQAANQAAHILAIVNAQQQQKQQ